jgi:RNA polymerase-binding transcription factor DksA
MKNSPSIRIMRNQASSEDDQVSLVDNEAHLEQQMAALDLSDETRRFLRDVHRAEKVLNNAYGKAQQDSPLDQRISQIYHDLYGSDDALLAND